MVEIVGKILSDDIEAILSDPVKRVTLKATYSMLFLSGADCRSCDRSLRTYYEQIEKHGKMKAKEAEKIKTRTCKPSWKGLKYSPIIHAHLSPDLLTDEKAVQCLELGILTEADFEVLPKKYKKPSRKAARHGKESKRAADNE